MTTMTTMTKNKSKCPDEILRLYQDDNITIYTIYHLDLLNIDGYIKTSTFSDYHSLSLYLKQIFQLNENDHQHLLLTLLYNKVIFSDFEPISYYLKDVP